MGQYGVLREVLSGEDLSHYSSKIESDGLKNVRIITVLLRKRRRNNRQFSGGPTYELLM